MFRLRIGGSKKMNLAQLKCLSVFSVFAVIGFGPISPGCLIGMFIVVMRPLWFLQLTHDLYFNNTFSVPLEMNSIKTNIRKKTFLFLLSLFMVDIAPVPVTPVVAFMIILSRPKWFYTLVLNIYATKAR